MCFLTFECKYHCLSEAINLHVVGKCEDFFGNPCRHVNGPYVMVSAYAAQRPDKRKFCESFQIKIDGPTMVYLL